MRMEMAIRSAVAAASPAQKSVWFPKTMGHTTNGIARLARVDSAYLDLVYPASIELLGRKDQSGGF